MMVLNVVRAELATPEISSSTSSSSPDSENDDNMSDLKIRIQEKLTESASGRRYLHENVNDWNDKKPVMHPQNLVFYFIAGKTKYGFVLDVTKTNC